MRNNNRRTWDEVVLKNQLIHRTCKPQFKSLAACASVSFLHILECGCVVLIMICVSLVSVCLENLHSAIGDSFLCRTCTGVRASVHPIPCQLLPIFIMQILAPQVVSWIQPLELLKECLRHISVHARLQLNA